MRLSLMLALIVAMTAALVLPLRAADYPEPTPYPTSWEFTFEYKKPVRVVVSVPGTRTPKAYWYVAYTVINEGEETQPFIPEFELLTENGKTHRTRRDVPKQVIDTIRSREKNRLMVAPTKVEGELRPGIDQARDSFAVWEEPEKDMGTFKIFVGGLSGEFVELKDKDTGKVHKDKKGEPIILRKQLQLTFSTNGDDVYPGEDVVREGEGRIGKNAKKWVMR
jgi:hypothetical protein